MGMIDIGRCKKFAIIRFGTKNSDFHRISVYSRWRLNLWYRPVTDLALNPCRLTEIFKYLGGLWLFLSRS